MKGKADGELEYLMVEVESWRSARDRHEVLSTRGLGSGLGISVFDPDLHLGGVLHAPLPLSIHHPDLAESSPDLFVDTAVTAVFDNFFAHGGRRSRMEVKVAGGSVPKLSDDLFRIGEKNLRVLEKIFAKNEIEVSAHCVGGTQSLRMRLHLDTGRVVLSSGSEEWDL